MTKLHRVGPSTTVFDPEMDRGVSAEQDQDVELSERAARELLASDPEGWAVVGATPLSDEVTHGR